jgi:hypothetical protein
LTRSSRTVPAVLAGLVVALLAAGISTAVVRRTGAGGGGDERLVDPGLAPVIAELEGFVESARGLRFLRPVDVAVLSDFAFRRKLSDGGAVDEPEADAEEGVLRALGLLDPGDDLGGVADLDPDAVAGFYDTDTKELVVRGVRLTPFVRQVLVHELTHALDDQHFGLNRDLVDDEAALAFEALAEGDATSVERRYVASLPPAERKAADHEEDATFGGGDPVNLPEVVVALADFPYDDGAELVEALRRAGGTGRVDAAFGAPPTTSAEVLHPDRFLAGRSRVPAPPVVAAGRVVEEGVLGELVLRLVVSGSVPEAEAGRAAAGWAGDRYVAWRAGRRTCVRAAVVLDSPADAGELTAALRRWATDHPGGQVEPIGAAAVSLSRCA